MERFQPSYLVVRIFRCLAVLLFRELEGFPMYSPQRLDHFNWTISAKSGPIDQRYTNIHVLVDIKETWVGSHPAKPIPEVLPLSHTNILIKLAFVQIRMYVENRFCLYGTAVAALDVNMY